MYILIQVYPKQKQLGCFTTNWLKKTATEWYYNNLRITSNTVRKASISVLIVSHHHPCQFWEAASN